MNISAESIKEPDPRPRISCCSKCWAWFSCKKKKMIPRELTLTEVKVNEVVMSVEKEKSKLSGKMETRTITKITKDDGTIAMELKIGWE
jgi:hypothetical protein